MGRDTCKLPGCKAEPREDGQDRFSNFFCSTAHELKYEHIKADAEEARRAEAEAARVDEPHRPSGP